MQLEVYGALFREWSNGVTARMPHGSETYAGTYRARIDRSLGGPQLGSEEMTEILRDLETLGAPQANGVVQSMH